MRPGPPAAPTGIRGESAELPVWDDVAPQKWFADALGLPAIVENDANAAAVAERLNGRISSPDSFAFIYFGNGIGLGVVEFDMISKSPFRPHYK